VSTIGKAIDLLGWFSTERPEIGLAEFQRLTQRDKTTTYRHLRALEAAGLVEQNPITRAYRMGPAVLRFAFIREATFPQYAGVRDALPRLADMTGETAHASIIQGDVLATLDVLESRQHSTRVVVDETFLPLHATASGLVVMAFNDGNQLPSPLPVLKSFTDHTLTTQAELKPILATSQKTGFAITEHSYEVGVCGIAAPLFDSSNGVAGAIAVATVASRFNPVLANTIKRELILAARQVTNSWGGCVPDELNATWDKTLIGLTPAMKASANPTQNKATPATSTHERQQVQPTL